MCLRILESFKIHYWPILTSFWFLATFVITYLMSVLSGHVYVYFPYISDTGALPPESCVFAQLVNMGCIFLAITTYLKYRFTSSMITLKKIKLERKWNTASIYTAFIGCLGISIVANFQEITVGLMHWVGAMMALGVGSFYFCIQTWIEFHYEKQLNIISRRILYLRTFMSFWLLPLFVLQVVCPILAIQQFKGQSIVWWTEKDGGFELRLTGSFTEWIMGAFIFIYVLTFTYELKLLKYNSENMTAMIEDTEERPQMLHSVLTK